MDPVTTTQETAIPNKVIQEKPQAKPSAPKTDSKIIWATGRRKTSIARVQMLPGKNSGKVSINGKTVDEFFKGNVKQTYTAMQSLKSAKAFGGELLVNVQGGGINGQAEAIRHGIARALSYWDDKLKVQMRKEGFLTRDPRAVERKKSGQPKARKRFQYSKR